MRTIIAIIACLFATSALAQTKVPTPQPRPKLTAQQAQINPLAVLQQFTLPDLEAALADAQAHNDTVSTPCWQALVTAVQQQQGPNLSLPSGVFSAIQKARDLKVAIQSAGSPSGPLATLNIACAPLILDGQNTLILLGLGAGAIAGTGGIAVPAIPGVLSLIPKL